MDNLNEIGEIAENGDDEQVVVQDHETERDSSMNAQGAIDEISNNGVGNGRIDLTNVPQDFGGHESKQYLEALGRVNIRVHMLMNFEPTQVAKYAECVEQLHNKGVPVQAIDFIHKTLHRPLLTMLREDGHLLQMANGEPMPFSTALSLLRDAMNNEWQVVLDTIRKRTQGDVTSVEDDVIQAIKAYKLTYDKASTALMYQEVTKVITDNKGINGELSKEEWERVFQYMKKSFIKQQHQLNNSTRVELERKLFLGKPIPNTLDDFFDELSKAWQDVRRIYISACQVLGYHKNSDRGKSRGEDDERKNRKRDRSRSRSRSRSKDKPRSVDREKRRKDQKKHEKIVGVCNKCGNNNDKADVKWKCFKGKCKLWDHPMANKSKETWENSEKGKALAAKGKRWLSPKLNIVNGNLIEDFDYKEVCKDCNYLYTLNGSSNENSSRRSYIHSTYANSEEIEENNAIREATYEEEPKLTSDKPCVAMEINDKYKIGAALDSGSTSTSASPIANFIDEDLAFIS